MATSSRVRHSTTDPATGCSNAFSMALMSTSAKLSTTCHQGKIEPERTCQVIQSTEGGWESVNGVSSHSVHEWDEGWSFHAPGRVLGSRNVVLCANTTTCVWPQYHGWGLNKGFNGTWLSSVLETDSGFKPIQDGVSKFNNRIHDGWRVNDLGQVLELRQFSRECSNSIVRYHEICHGTAVVFTVGSTVNTTCHGKFRRGQQCWRDVSISLSHVPRHLTKWRRRRVPCWDNQSPLRVTAELHSSCRISRYAP